MKNQLIEIYIKYGLDPIHYNNMTNDLFRLFNISGSLDLDLLEKNLDESLSKETPESINEWLNLKRQ
jgi:hypothetical protein